MVAVNLSWLVVLGLANVFSAVAHAAPVDEGVDLQMPALVPVAGDEGGDQRSEAHQLHGPSLGATAGIPWSDKTYIETGRHRRIAGIRTYCGERLSGIQFAYADLEPDNFKPVLEWGPLHGNGAAYKREIFLSESNYVTALEISTVKAKHGTRIGYLGIATIKYPTTMDCGTRNDANVQTFNVDFGKYTLLYMSGFADKEVDALQGHFIPLTDYSRYGRQPSK